MRVVCPYCGAAADKVSSQWGTKYECLPCDARVGCHRGTDKPLGTLANAPLRDARMRAHAAFDTLWRSCGIPRREAYAWLGGLMQLKRDACHIGLFTMEQCERVVQYSTQRANDLITQTEY